MLDGKKSVAERIVYGAIDILEKKAGNDKSENLMKAKGSAKGAVASKSQRSWSIPQAR